jgi:hypothetical protein
MKKSVLTFLLAGLYLFSTNAQQAWTKQKGKFYTQIGASFLTYSELINGSDDPISLGRTVRDRTVQAYGEYGLTNRLTVALQVPLNFSSVGDFNGFNIGKSGSLIGFGNVRAALTANILKKNGLVAAAKITADLPTARFDRPTGLRTGFDATTASPAVLVGFARSRWFTSGEFGRAFRTNEYSSRTFGAAQIGRFFGKKRRFLAIFAAEYMKSRKNGNHDDASSIYTGMYLDRQSYLAYLLKTAWIVQPKIKIWFATGTGIGAANVAVGRVPSYSVSVSYQND